MDKIRQIRMSHPLSRYLPPNFTSKVDALLANPISDARNVNGLALAMSWSKADGGLGFEMGKRRGT